MGYLVEVFDVWGRRVGAYDSVPLMEAVRTAPDQADRVRGLLPGLDAAASPMDRMRVWVDGRLHCDARVTRVTPHWGDTRRLVVDQYVDFHELLEVEAESGWEEGNRPVTRGYVNTEVSALVKSAINSAPGPVHYLVAHTAYPGGAQREYAKFAARKTSANELTVGGIDAGQWVGGTRLDASGAYAKDGDTIAGLVVDGAAWPDLRLMMIDCEETARNSHAVARHPEVADWTDARYAASGYKLRADEATAALQDLLDTKGLDFVELNPHKDADGAYDDRVDAYGRYIGLVYGGGECFNAAMAEKGLADVYLYEDGAYHDPSMALKEYFSYTQVCEDSVEWTGRVLSSLDVSAGLYELLTALAYAAGCFVWSAGPDLAVRFRRADGVDRVWHFDSRRLGVSLGSAMDGVVNVLHFSGNPVTAALEETYGRWASVDEYGYRDDGLLYLGISTPGDAQALAEGLLADVAYPEAEGEVVFFHGEGDVRVGDLAELRGDNLCRIGRKLDNEWDGAFAGRLVRRVCEVRHLLTGRKVSTRVRLTSPLRSVKRPLTFMVRSQPSVSSLYQFRLDDDGVGLDMSYYLA